MEGNEYYAGVDLDHNQHLAHVQRPAHLRYVVEDDVGQWAVLGAVRQSLVHQRQGRRGENKVYD